MMKMVVADGNANDHPAYEDSKNPRGRAKSFTSDAKFLQISQSKESSCMALTFGLNNQLTVRILILMSFWLALWLTRGKIEKIFKGTET